MTKVDGATWLPALTAACIVNPKLRYFGSRFAHSCYLARVVSPWNLDLTPNSTFHVLWMRGDIRELRLQISKSSLGGPAKSR